MSPTSVKLAVAALAAVSALAVAAPAGAVTITEFPIGGLEPGETQPQYIASSPSGRLWFTDTGTAHGVRQMNTAGELIGSVISVPAGGSAPTGDLAFDTDGTLKWTVNEAGDNPHPYIVTRAANGSVDDGGDYEGIRDGYALAYVGGTLYVTFRYLDEKGKTAGYTVCIIGGGKCFGQDVIDSRLTDLTLDQSGRLWAAQPEGDAIRRTNAARTAFDLTVPLPGASRPGRAALGPDGNIWVAAFGNAFDDSNTKNQIIRVTPEGATTPFVLPPGRGANDIVAGPDGALWFTEFLSGSIGRITTCGEYKSYPLPNPLATPYGIVAGADGALWFTEIGNAKIGRLLPDPPAGDCPAPVDTTAPDLGGLSLSRSAFRAAPSGASTSGKRAPIGTKVSFSLSEASSVAFTVERRSAGRSAGGRCAKPAPSNAGHKRCTRWVKVSGSFASAGQAGANAFTFRGRLGGKKLPPGGYRLNAQATDVAKNASSTQRKGFTILP